MTDQSATLQSRIAKLERRIRTLTLVCVGLPSLAFLLGADTAERLWNGKKVTAEEFVLVNTDGDVRARLSAHGRDGRLVLHDENGNPRVLIAGRASEGGPSLSLFSSSGKYQLVAGIDRESEVGVVHFLYKNGQLMESVGGSTQLNK